MIRGGLPSEIAVVLQVIPGSALILGLQRLLGYQCALRHARRALLFHSAVWVGDNALRMIWTTAESEHGGMATTARSLLKDVALFKRPPISRRMCRPTAT